MAENSTRSLIEALHAKYGCDDSEFDHIFISKKAPGKSDEGKLVLPRLLSMDEEKISIMGDEEELRQICGQVRELDLSWNNISDWDQVRITINCLPYLTFLNISNNPLLPSDSPLPTGVCSGNKLTRLILNATNTSWQCVKSLLKVFTSLQELSLSCNPLATFDITDFEPYPSLTQLFMNANNISDWNEVIKLGQIFPNLSQLVMIGNPITDLHSVPQDGADDDVTRKAFPNLSILNVSQTLLSTWETIEKFRSFPSLTDIRLNDIPFLEAMEERHRWEFLIAYLPNIERINRSPVGSEERVNAERNFIRFFMDKEEKPSRYHELAAQHGRLEPLAKVDLTPPGHVSMTLEFEESRTQMFIDTRKTVRQVKNDVCEFIGHPPSKVNFFHLDKDSPQGLQRLGIHMNRFVHAIPFHDGDELIAVLKFVS